MKETFCFRGDKNNIAEKLEALKEYYGINLSATMQMLISDRYRELVKNSSLKERKE